VHEISYGESDSKSVRKTRAMPRVTRLICIYSARKRLMKHETEDIILYRVGGGEKHILKHDSEG